MLPTRIWDGLVCVCVCVSIRDAMIIQPFLAGEAFKACLATGAAPVHAMATALTMYSICLWQQFGDIQHLLQKIYAKLV